MWNAPRHIHLLFIGDDADFSQRIAAWLESRFTHLRVKALLSSTAAALFDQITASPGASLPNLIFLDLAESKDQATALLTQIKGDAVLHRIPVTVFTGSSDSQAAQQMYHLGANCCLPRPEHPAALENLLLQAVQFWLETVILPPTRVKE